MRAERNVSFGKPQPILHEPHPDRGSGTLMVQVGKKYQRIFLHRGPKYDARIPLIDHLRWFDSTKVGPIQCDRLNKRHLQAFQKLLTVQGFASWEVNYLILHSWKYQKPPKKIWTLCVVGGGGMNGQLGIVELSTATPIADKVAFLSAPVGLTIL